MSEQETHNKLSAFHDGELTPAETESIRTRLEHDPAARRELEELRRLSALLSDLPRQTLPSGFAGQVLQRCEQESLFPADHAEENRTSESRARSKPNGRRSTIAIAVSILATSAMLFLMLRMVSPPVKTDHSMSKRENTTQNNRDQMAGNDGANSNFGLEKEDAKDREPAVVSTDRSKRSDAPANRRIAGTSNRTVRKRAAPTASFGKKSIPHSSTKRFRRSVKNTVPGIGIAGDKKSAAFRLGGAGAGAGGRRFSYDDHKLLDSFRVGDVIPYLEVSGNRTAVIEVTVIDVRKAVGRMEVLLRKTAVMPLAGKKSTKLLLKSKNGTGESRSELIAVYVEFTQDQLKQVMRELGRVTKSVHIALKPPVPFGDVRLKGDGEYWAMMFRKDRRRSPLTLADAVDYSREKSRLRTQPTNGSHKSVAPKPDEQGKKKTERKPTKKNRKGSSTVPGSAESKKTPAGLKRKSDRVAAGRSFQIRVRLFAPNEKSRDGRQLATSSSRANGKPTGTASLKNKSAGKADKDSAVSARPVRVMFVFRPKAVARPRSKPKRP